MGCASLRSVLASYESLGLVVLYHMNGTCSELKVRCMVALVVVADGGIAGVWYSDVVGVWR